MHRVAVDMPFGALAWHGVGDKRSAARETDYGDAVPSAASRREKQARNFIGIISRCKQLDGSDCRGGDQN